MIVNPLCILTLKNCTNKDADAEVEDRSSEEKLFDEEIDQMKQIFNFITVPSFASLYSGSSIKPLYFVQVTGKGIAEEDISDPYGHSVAKGERYCEGLYLKLVRSRSTKVKRFSRLPNGIVIAPDEIYDTHVDLNDDLELDISVHNMLIRKASC